MKKNVPVSKLYFSLIIVNQRKYVLNVYGKTFKN